MNVAQQYSAAVNVAHRLTAMANVMPDAMAIAEPTKAWPQKRSDYRSVTFEQLDRDSSRIAAGLNSLGVSAGTRIALLVPPSIDFISLVFALFKTGAVTILIDPGMGRRNLIRCLEEARPEGFIGIPIVHAIRRALRRRFADAKFNVTVGRGLLWSGPTLKELRSSDATGFAGPATQPQDPAAIIFTTGSTGPPKGVLYRHGNFDHQVSELRDFYRVQPGEVDVPCFPLFGLFNCAMGVTTVLPRMDPTRPAKVDPRKIVQAVADWNVTQGFGSPAVWNRVGQYCETTGASLPTLRRVLSAGAPVPTHVLRRMKKCIHTDGDVHTPYGATEALPVASIAASEVLAATASVTACGGGVCVGRKFPSIEWKVIDIVDGPIRRLSESRELPSGEIGELIVSGPVVTTEYVTRVEANATAKIQDDGRFWHRMGDVGYFDAQGRFWFCGRLAHRVVTEEGPMYTISCEAIFNEHPRVFRSALVGIGAPGEQVPVILVEPKQGCYPKHHADNERLVGELRDLALENPLTRPIKRFLVHPKFPVDIRHNAKIFREKLAVWASKRISV